MSLQKHKIDYEPRGSGMKYFKKFVTLAVFLLAICAIPAAAQDIKEDPGYVEFSGISDQLGYDVEREINIHGPILRLVIAAARKDDPELAELLTTVTGIFVRRF